MEVAARSLSSHGKLSCPPSLLLQLKPSSSINCQTSQHLQFSNSTSFHRQLRGARVRGIGPRRVLEPVRASEGAVATGVAERWLLQPIGDGDSRHIGFKVQMPGAYEIVSDEVTVGRLPEKANMVIPVATVSGIHARIQKQGGRLLITDLDSTNGTFIDEKRLRPGVPAVASPGNRITFGDTHLAIFMLSKLEYMETVTATSPEESVEKPEQESDEIQAESADTAS